jgi:hypothetical protein
MRTFAHIIDPIQGDVGKRLRHMFWELVQIAVPKPHPSPSVSSSEALKRLSW